MRTSKVNETVFFPRHCAHTYAVMMPHRRIRSHDIEKADDLPCECTVSMTQHHEVAECPDLEHSQRLVDKIILVIPSLSQTFRHRRKIDHDEVGHQKTYIQKLDQTSVLFILGLLASLFLFVSALMGWNPLQANIVLQAWKMWSRNDSLLSSDDVVKDYRLVLILEY